MRIQTILNRVEKFKSFVYGAARLEERAGPPHLNSWKIKGFRQNDTAGQAHPRPHVTADATKNTRKLDAVALPQRGCCEKGGTRLSRH